MPSFRPLRDLRACFSLLSYPRKDMVMFLLSGRGGDRRRMRPFRRSYIRSCRQISLTRCKACTAMNRLSFFPPPYMYTDFRQSTPQTHCRALRRRMVEPRTSAGACACSRSSSRIRAGPRAYRPYTKHPEQVSQGVDLLEFPAD